MPGYHYLLLYITYYKTIWLILEEECGMTEAALVNFETNRNGFKPGEADDNDTLWPVVLFAPNNLNMVTIFLVFLCTTEKDMQLFCC